MEGAPSRLGLAGASRDWREGELGTGTSLRGVGIGGIGTGGKWVIYMHFISI